MKYVEPTIVIIELEMEDVITASTNGDFDGQNSSSVPGKW